MTILQGFPTKGITDSVWHQNNYQSSARAYKNSLGRSAAITDVQHLLGHASVKTTERAYAAFVKNKRFKLTIDLLDEPVLPKLKIVK